jgi:hypothetical protein
MLIDGADMLMVIFGQFRCNTNGLDPFPAKAAKSQGNIGWRQPLQECLVQTGVPLQAITKMLAGSLGSFNRNNCKPGQHQASKLENNLYSTIKPTACNTIKTSAPTADIADHAACVKL